MIDDITNWLHWFFGTAEGFPFEIGLVACIIFFFVFRWILRSNRK